MVTSNLTENKIIAGEALIRVADEANQKINAAFWLYVTEQESWKLLFSIKGIDKTGPKSIYNKFQMLIKKANVSDEISLSEISLLKKNAPLLSLLRLAIQTGPGISGIRFTGNVVNGHLIPDSYIYRIE